MALEEREILFTNSFDRRRHQFWLRALGLLAAALLLFSRCPSRLLRPELWAEDGREWLAHAYNYGPSMLLQPEMGYLQTLSRLSAALAVCMPLSWAPFWFALVAFCIQIIPVGLLLSARGQKLIPSLGMRLLLVVFYIGEPNAGEVFVNLTNAMWYLAITAFLLVVLPKPVSRWGKRLDLATLTLSGLSGPLVLFLAPVAWWHAAAGRRTPEFKARLLYAVIESAWASTQFFCILAGHAKRDVGPLDANFIEFVHILTNQLFLGGMIGSHEVNGLMADPAWMTFWPAALVCGGGAAVIVMALVKGPSVYRQFMLFGGLIVASGLISPLVSVQPQWTLMQRPDVGSRYFLVAMLGWSISMVVLAARPWARFGHYVARALLVLWLIGLVNDWFYPAYPHTDFRIMAAAFAKTPPGTVMMVSQNPQGWMFSLTKH